MADDRPPSGSPWIEHQLQTRREWDLGEIPLSELLAYIRKDFRMGLSIDLPALQDEGIDPSKPVEPPVGTTSLDTLLSMTLEREGLTYFVEDGILVITTKTKADESLVWRVSHSGPGLAGRVAGLPAECDS